MCAFSGQTRRLHKALGVSRTCPPKLARLRRLGEGAGPSPMCWEDPFTRLPRRHHKLLDAGPAWENGPSTCQFDVFEIRDQPHHPRQTGICCATTCGARPAGRARGCAPCWPAIEFMVFPTGPRIGRFSNSAGVHPRRFWHSTSSAFSRPSATSPATPMHRPGPSPILWRGIAPQVPTASHCAGFRPVRVECHPAVRTYAMIPR